MHKLKLCRSISWTHQCRPKFCGVCFESR